MGRMTPEKLRSLESLVYDEVKNVPARRRLADGICAGASGWEADIARIKALIGGIQDVRATLIEQRHIYYEREALDKLAALAAEREIP